MPQVGRALRNPAPAEDAWMVRVKVCGITQREDLDAACAAGVDALGFNLAKGPRRIGLEQAAALCAATPPFVTRVLLFVDAELAVIRAALRATRADAVQLHGDEPPELARELQREIQVIKAFRVRDAASLDAVAAYPADAYLLDAWVEGAEGGTGASWDHRLLADRQWERPLILAGGLRPENVAAAVAATRPWAVDTASGVEAVPGRKDAAAMTAFVRAAKRE
jgi:phosphoribosylanthranilate isomerase